jgi:signal transduction histidine kinase
MPCKPFVPNTPLPVRILLIDDRVENLIALEAAFKDSNYKLFSALSGKEAIQIVAEEEFAVILLDVQMPVMDGFETAELIRKSETGRRTPIIFLTAIHRTEIHEKKGYQLGAVDFLFKPLDTDILLSKVAVFADLYRKTKEIERHSKLITEKALEEQELYHLKKALEARDEFISIATHELNTPITPLSLQMQYFLKLNREGRFKDIDPERLERMLSAAYGQVERLSRIIRDLVDVSRITIGKLNVQKSEVFLHEIAQFVIEAFQEETRRLGVKVNLEVRSHPKGQWDRMRVEQVFINLFSNALKYGLGKPITITLDQEHSNAIVRVADQGIGIEEEDQTRIFERFERAASVQNFGGLGLGLYISKEIIHPHGGKISLESQKDQGTCISFELPY